MRGHEHRTLFPDDAAPENFWNAATRGRSVLFDTKKGRRRDVRWIDEGADAIRSEEHTSELQSLTNLVCRLLLEKKKTQK